MDSRGWEWEDPAIAWGAMWGEGSEFGLGKCPGHWTAGQCCRTRWLWRPQEGRGTLERGEKGQTGPGQVGVRAERRVDGNAGSWQKSEGDISPFVGCPKGSGRHRPKVSFGWDQTLLVTFVCVSVCGGGGAEGSLAGGGKTGPLRRSVTWGGQRETGHRSREEKPEGAETPTDPGRLQPSGYRVPVPANTCPSQ